MQYSININQVAIAKYNQKQHDTKLDLIDACIIEYLQKQSTSSFAKRNFIIKDNAIFYLLCYNNIISQLPLITIETKDAIGRRIKKLKTAKIINHFIDRKNMNKVYFNTTDLFETFFSYYQTDEKTKPNGFQSESQTDEKTNQYNDNNINDNNINDKEKINKKENECLEAEILTATEIQFQEIYKTYTEKDTIANKTLKSTSYELLYKKYQKALKKHSYDDILQGIQDYIIFFKASKMDDKYKFKLSNFLKREYWLGDDRGDWREQTQKILLNSNQGQILRSIFDKKEEKKDAIEVKELPF